jgi:hypothetical protein
MVPALPPVRLLAFVLVAARAWKDGAEVPPLDVRTWPAEPAGIVVRTPEVVVTTGRFAVAPIAPALVRFPCVWLVGVLASERRESVVITAVPVMALGAMPVEGALPLAVPVRLAVIVPALKFPLASRATMALAVLALVAVVRALANVPEVMSAAAWVCVVVVRREAVFI